MRIGYQWTGTDKSQMSRKSRKGLRSEWIVLVRNRQPQRAKALLAAGVGVRLGALGGEESLQLSW